MTDTEWTLRTLKALLENEIRALREYHDQSVRAQSEATRVAMSASEKAIGKSEKAVDKRLDQMLIGYQAAHATLVDSVDKLAQRLDVAEGKGRGFNQSWLIFIGAISTIGALVTIIILITGR